MKHSHVIPVGLEEPIHDASPKCWCHPLQDTESATLYIHNARDCRERFERQGLTHPESHWVTIGELLE